MLVNSLLKAVVVPAATAAVELTGWQWFAAGMVIGSVVKNLAEKEEKTTYERLRRDCEDA